MSTIDEFLVMQSMIEKYYLKNSPEEIRESAHLMNTILLLGGKVHG